MRSLLVLVALLGLGCSVPQTLYPDASVSDADRPDAFLATPTCRPLAEDPTCMGACDGLQARCPPGDYPACGGHGQRWMVSVDGVCYVPGFGIQCDTGTPTCHEGNPVCVPPLPSMCYGRFDW